MGSRSIFALVEYSRMLPQSYGFLQLDPGYDEKVDEKVYEKVHFNLPDEPFEHSSLRWVFSPPRSSSEDLYMVPDWRFDWNIIEPLNGYKFNFSTGSFLPITLPKYYESCSHVVRLRENIYLISPDYYFDTGSIFQCYDPAEDLWKPLAPLPDLNNGEIVATAVWDDAVLGDTILLNVKKSGGGGDGIWAYDVRGNKWYLVKVEGSRRCQVTVGSIVGEAVVLKNTIYALTDWSVLVLSIEKKVIDGDFVIECSLLTDMVTNIDPVVSDQGHVRTRYLVHLGNNKFCVVETGILFFLDKQCIDLTYIQINEEDNSVTVMGKRLHEVKIQRYGSSLSDSFHITLCFSMCKGATTVLKEGKSCNLDPCASDNLNSKGAEGRSIYVRKLPPNPTVGQLEERLKKFGSIKRDGIQIGKDDQGKHFAYVEFESATSKQLAIQAKTIKIGRYAAQMLEKRLTGPTLVDCKAEGSSSIAKNKFKNHGKVSRSKTTAVDTME